MDHRTIVSFFTCQLVWVNRYRREALIKDGKEAFVDMDVFYQQDNIFYLPEETRWSFIQAHAKQDDIAVLIDTALSTIEKRNPSLQGALPDNYPPVSE